MKLKRYVNNLKKLLAPKSRKIQGLSLLQLSRFTTEIIDVLIKHMDKIAKMSGATIRLRIEEGSLVALTRVIA